jgi:hypothetical protein
MPCVHDNLAPRIKSFGVSGPTAVFHARVAGIFSGMLLSRLAPLLKYLFTVPQDPVASPAIGFGPIDFRW